LELPILKLFWRDGSLNVRQVREALAAGHDRDLAHTTVVTTLNTMTEKGLLAREQVGKAYLYTANVAEQEISQGMLADMLNRVFDGSAEALLLNLLESEHVDEEAHRALRRLINRKRRGESS
jgi:predicted transcriptional regulator